MKSRDMKSIDWRISSSLFDVCHCFFAMVYLRRTESNKFIFISSIPITPSLSDLVQDEWYGDSHQSMSAQYRRINRLQTEY